MAEPPEREGVGRDFALIVFGGAAALVAHVGFFILYDGERGLAWFWHSRLSFALWAASFAFFALRGFWIPGPNVFGKLESPALSLPTPLLAALGVWLTASDGPVGDMSRTTVGATLIVLSYVWSFLSPVWRKIHLARPLQPVGIDTPMWAIEYWVLIALGTLWLPARGGT